MRGFEDLPSDWTHINVWMDEAGNAHQSVEFVVAGQPIQKGNIIKSNRGAYHDATKGIGEWVEMVQAGARNAMANGYGRRLATQGDPDIYAERLPMFLGAVEVSAIFVRERLKTAPKTSTPPLIKKPDLDKLLRGIFDGMTEIVYKDDSQVIGLGRTGKRSAHPGERPGVHITVSSDVVVE